MSASEIETILSDLNPKQREAVVHGEGPLLILAGAGTGKTTVLTRRIAWLIASKKARPDQVLALTFTDRAALEMEERVDRLLPYGWAPLNVMTFHAFGQSFFEANALRLGLCPSAEVLSDAPLKLFLRRHLFELPLSIFRPLGKPDEHVDSLIKLFSRAKDEAITPEAWKQAASGDPEQEELACAYAAYDKLLHQQGFLDHGDQLLLLLRLLREDAAVRRKTREAYPWILVDEFQDTNTVQFEILKLLAPPKEADNLTVVGDDDQAIYRFRGASLNNILGFRQAYPHAALQALTLNYRSRQDILDCAHRLIQFNNPERLEAREGLDKRLRAARSAVPRDGQAVFYRPYETRSAELAALALEIAKEAAAGLPYSAIAVLTRTNTQAEQVFQELCYRGIPACFQSARGLYRRQELRLCLRFLYALAKPEDNGVLFDYLTDPIYNLPIADLQAVLAWARTRNLSLHQALRRGALCRAELEMEGKFWEKVERSCADLSRYTALAQRQGVAACLYQFLDDSGVLSGLLGSKDPEAARQVANLARFFESLKSFERIERPGRWLELIEYLELLIQEGEDPHAEHEGAEGNAITVSTVHRAKGLEWDRVYVTGLEDQHFPLRRQGGELALPAALAPSSQDERASHLAEERRLLYVAMTRARDALLLSWARDYGTKRPWKRSPFLQEALNLPKQDMPLRLSPSACLQRHGTGNGDMHPLLAPFPPLAAEETLRLSYYPVDDYLTCPLKYKIAHVLGLKPPPHFALTYGRVMHEVVQQHNRAVIEGRMPTLVELQRIYEQSWNPEGYFSRQHEEARFQNGLRRLEAFLQDEVGLDRLPLLVEHPFEIFLSPCDVLSGRMDRVDQNAQGEITILDYKTSKIHERKKASQEVAKSLQLAIYALAWRETRGRLPDWLELCFLESGIRERLKPDDDYMQKKEAEIRLAFAGLRAGNYEPDPEFMKCKSCAYHRICPSAAVQAR